MAVPSNPGWPEDYVPSAAEWAAAFSGKMDYPGPVSQGGTGAITAQGANENLALRSLQAANFTAQVLNTYGAQTSFGAITASLPAISSTTPGDSIVILDVDYDANTNNITVSAFSGDDIVLYGSAATTQVINIPGTRATLYANVSNWTMVIG